MSYATYTTDALVCGTFNRNTADRSYLLFTREAGMLYADARSVREERSRQRYAMQDFSQIRVSLVKGRRGWKIGSVEAVSNHFLAATSREARGSVVALYRTLRRFIRGEEASPQLYDFCQDSLGYVTESISERNSIELFIQVKLLTALGYVSELALPKELRNLSLEEVTKVASEKLQIELVKIIDQAVENSQL